jgi:cation:H+ antiporter
VLLGIFMVFLWRSFHRASIAEDSSESPPTRLIFAIFMVILGCVMLPIGGELMVSSTITYAKFWNIPEGIIALFAIGIGTSLPELSASIVASIKRRNDIVIGNIIGSNIFNVGFILSLSGILTPLQLPDYLKPILFLFLGISLLLAANIYIKQRKQKKTAYFSRIESGVLLILYGIFIAIGMR